MQAEKIVAIKHIGKHKTIDIEVDNEDHLFFANGILTSNSHSMSYAYLSYLTAYIKAHFPLQFYWSYLYHARGESSPRDEVAELVEDAKKLDIYVMPPDLRLMNERFEIINNQIYFGITDIKNVGSSHFDELKKYSDIGNMSWHKIICDVLYKMNKRVSEGLIKSGALRWLGVDRTKMLYEYKMIQILNDKEVSYISECCNDLKTGLQEILKLPTGRGQVVTTSARTSKLESVLNSLINPPFRLTDTAADIAKMEQDSLGLPITCTALSDNKRAFTSGNSTCSDFLSGHLNKNIMIPCIIEEVRKIKTQKGDDMAFLKIRDDTSAIESVVVFPKQWEDLKSKCREQSMIVAHGNRSAKNKNSLILEKIIEIN